MPRPVILVATPMEADLLARLEAAGEVRRLDPAATAEALLEAAREASAIVMSPLREVDAAFLDAAPRLRVIAGTGVGYDHFDVGAATARGVAICNTPGVLDAAVADLATALILALARRLFEFAAYVRGGGWSRREPRPPLGHDVAGKTLGVIGFGRIGREVARRMGGLGMRVLWRDTYAEAPPDAPPAERRALDDLLRESDFVTIHADLNPGSRGLIGARELALMRPGAYLVNTARGGIVDQAALREALEAGTIAGAALDVFEAEPPDRADPLPGLPNVIALPHVGTATEETRRAMRELAVANLLAVLAGEPPPAVVNPDALAPRGAAP